MAFHFVKAAFDLPVTLKSGDRMGFGLQTNIQQLSSFYNLKGAGLFTNYQKQVSKSSSSQQLLSAGLQLNVVNTSVGDLRWSSQNNNGVFDPNLPPEPGQFDKTYLDVGIGLAYLLKVLFVSV